jgi:ribosome-binding factor A
MADEGRAARLADRIKVIVAQMLEQRVKDPRLGFITITDVRVTGDLREAMVFYTVYGDDSAWADTAAALKSVTGMLRTEVGKRTGVKFTPTLAFQPDAVPETARSIDELLARAAAADAQVHELAEHGTYAGEADPYRHPDDEGDDDDLDGDDDGEAGDADVRK